MDQESQAIIRLNKLMKSGYVIDEHASQEVQDAIWLEHPAKSRAEETSLILYSDGLVVSSSIDSDKKQLRLTPDQVSEFDGFINRVPVSNLWEKSVGLRSNIIAWLYILTIMALGAFVSNFLLKLFD